MSNEKKEANSSGNEKASSTDKFQMATNVQGLSKVPAGNWNDLSPQPITNIFSKATEKGEHLPEN